MCGIIGFYSPEPTDEHFKLLQELILQSKIRGLHAFGTAYYNDVGEIQVKKTDCLATEWLLESKPNMLIYHNRYSTSGDYVNMNNNQPLLVGDMALAFNGVLSMDKKEVFEAKYNVKCNSDNDGEVFLQKIMEGEDIVEFLKQEKQCSFAGLFLREGRVYALRNNKRPLYWFKYRNAVFVVSTSDIVKRALGYLPEGLEPIKPYVLECLNDKL